MQIKLFLCLPVCFMWLTGSFFHGSISEMDEVVLLTLLTGCYLFVCVLQSSLVFNAVFQNSSTVSTERNVALLTAGVPWAVVGNWVQSKAGLFSLGYTRSEVAFLPTEVQICVFLTILLVWMLLFLINMWVISTVNAPHIFQPRCLVPVICINLQLGQGPDLAPWAAIWQPLGYK